MDARARLLAAMLGAARRFDPQSRVDDASNYGAILGEALLNPAFGAELLKDYAAQSAQVVAFRHANGFIKLLLGQDAVTGANVRLHVWRDGDFPSDLRTAPHSHPWRLLSWPVCGVLRTKSYSQASSGENYRRFRREKHSSSGEHHLIESGFAELRVSGIDWRSPGSSYFLEKGAIHAAAGHGTSIAATVSVTVPVASGEYSDFVYHPASFPTAAGRHEHTRLKAAEVKDLLLSLITIWGRA